MRFSLYIRQLKVLAQGWYRLEATSKKVLNPYETNGFYTFGVNFMDTHPNTRPGNDAHSRCNSRQCNPYGYSP